jgi:hypothetical protein
MGYNIPVKSLASAVLVRQKDATTEKIAQWDLCSIDISRQMADSIGHFRARMAVKMHTIVFEIILDKMALFRLEGQNEF